MSGASRRQQEATAPARADALEDVVLPAAEGHEVRLGDLWAEGPAVLAFLRHYG